MGVTVTGLDELIERNESIAERAKDMSPAMERALIHMQASTEDRFDAEISPAGKRWKRHAPSTRRGIARQRRGRVGASKVLTQSALLRKSIASGTTSTADKDSLTIGTKVEYAAAHQFGFKGTVRVPAHTRKRTKAKKKKKVTKQASRERKAKAKKTRTDERNRRGKLSSRARASEDANKKKASKARKSKAPRKKLGSAKKESRGPIKVSAFSRKMNMPKREFLGFSADDLEAIEEIVTDYLLTGE